MHTFQTEPHFASENEAKIAHAYLEGKRQQLTADNHMFAEHHGKWARDEMDAICDLLGRLAHRCDQAWQTTGDPAVQKKKTRK